MNTMRISELIKKLEVIKTIWGDKKVLLSDDDEWNGFHICTGDIIANKSLVKRYAEIDLKDLEDYILLG